MNYTIKVTKEEYDFILTAVDAYVSGLRQKMADQATIWLISTASEKMASKVETKKEPAKKKRQGRTWTPEQRRKQSELAIARWQKANEAKA